MEDYTARQLNESMEQLARELHLNGENMAGSAEYLGNIINNHTKKMQELIDSNEQVIRRNNETNFINAINSVSSQYTQIKIAYRQKLLAKDDIHDIMSNLLFILESSNTAFHYMENYKQRFDKYLMPLYEKIEKIYDATENIEKEEDFNF